VNPNKLTIYPTHTCFDDAIEYLTHTVKSVGPKTVHAHYSLVHGICLHPDGRPYSHAWVERTTASHRTLCIGIGRLESGEPVAYEGAKEEYYDNFQVQKTYKYTIKEMIKHNYEHGTYGPWLPELLQLCRNYSPPDQAHQA
jgi:hypothetical protein